MVTTGAVPHAMLIETFQTLKNCNIYKIGFSHILAQLLNRVISKRSRLFKEMMDYAYELNTTKRILTIMHITFTVISILYKM